MDTSNVAGIVISHINTEPINSAIKKRAEVLSEQMNPEAAEEFVSEMGELMCTVEQNGDTASFKVKPSTSYLINYLKNHGTPVLGGDNGLAHNVDGTTYESNVPERLWGVPLPELELPTIEGEDEAYHIVEMLASDATQDAVNQSKHEITEKVAVPFFSEQFKSLGG